MSLQGRDVARNIRAETRKDPPERRIITRQKKERQQSKTRRYMYTNKSDPPREVFRDG